MRLLPLLFTIFIAGCSSKNVWVDVDDPYTFRGKRAYAWSEVLPVPNEIMQRRIEGWIDEELAARGLTRIEVDEGDASGAPAPDLFVTTEFGARREVRSTGGSATVGVSRRAGRGRVGMGTTMGNQIYEVSIGALVIALLAATAVTGDGEAALRIAFIPLACNVLEVPVIRGLPVLRVLPVRTAAENKAAALAGILGVVFVVPASARA